MKGEIFDFDITEASKLIADALVSSNKERLEVITYVNDHIILDEREALLHLDLSTISSSALGILDPLGQLRDWLASTFDAISSFIISSVNSFASNIILPAITSVSNYLRFTILPALSALSDALSSARSVIISSIYSTTSFISNALSTAISSAFNSVVGFISNFGSSITSAINSLGVNISNLISSFSLTLLNSITNLGSLITQGVNTLTSIIQSSISTITFSVLSGISSLSNILRSSTDAIITTSASFFQSLYNLIQNVGAGLINTITSAIGTTNQLIQSSSSSVIGFTNLVATNLSQLLQSIYSALSTSLSVLDTKITQVISDIRSLPSLLSSGLTNLAGVFTSAFNLLASRMADNMRDISKDIKDLWNFLVGAFKEILTYVNAGFDSISKAFMGFTNAVARLPESLAFHFSEIGEWIWKALPNSIIQFFGSPFGWALDNIFTPVINALAWFGQNLWVGLQNIWGMLLTGLQAVGKVIVESLSKFGNWVIDLSRSFAEGVITSGEKLAEGLKTILFTPIEALLKTFGKGMSDFSNQFLERIKKGEVKGEWLEITGMFLMFLQTQYTFRVIRQLLFWLSEHLNFSIAPTVSIKILGSGGDVQVKEIPIKLGALLKHIGTEFGRWSDLLMNAYWYGIAIWGTQPVMRMFNQIWRNRIPVEVPPVEDILEAVRRSFPHEKAETMISTARYFLTLYGYADYVIDMYLQSNQNYNITITDRFGTQRLIPLAMAYRLPSPSDVARMMIRDVFASLEDFQRIYLATGMDRDIGALYYFLHFRYPPPERLWNFLTRGISGLLWAPLPNEELQVIKQEAEGLKAFLPVAPVQMNFQASKLLTAFKTYMKWHDFARFSWIKDFPSDNLIVTDTLADIPTKIDQRWMIKWGIYQHLSSFGITHQSPVTDFSKIIEMGVATAEEKSGIYLDIRNFCRTLQATGLHPDWVVPTAIAETMNVLTEERTLLRTGFMNLFKEGFWDTRALEVFLSGFIVTIFDVARFDLNTLQWTEGKVKLPVMFLPPERKLLELRALMDRSLDILRDIQKDISTAYQEFIIWDYNEYKKRLTDVIDRINEFFSTDYKAITGRSLPDELKLKFVEAYYKPYVEALRTWRDVFTIRRVRLWTSRWLGWLMYRVASGAVSLTQVDELITYVADKAKLTDYEKNFIKEVSEKMYRLTASDYIPTPSTLATLSEYLQLEEDLIKKTLKERNVPEEWVNYWLKYISVRPIKADAKTLLTTYVRALRYGVIKKEELDGFIKVLPQYGFTSKEIEFLQKRIELETAIDEINLVKKEYVPTPSMLATLSEYITIPDELINEALVGRGLSSKWITLWKTYIQVKPLKADAKSLLSTYVRAFRYGLVKKDDMDTFVKSLATYGFTEQEISFLLKRVELEEAITLFRENSREYIPTLSQLATLAEFVIIKEEHIKKVFEARKVPAEWQKLWLDYISVRPLVDDIRGLITSYRRALLYVQIPKDLEEKIKSYAQLINFTDKEFNILQLRVQLEEMVRDTIESRREYIPTPMSLATLVEFLPEAREFFDDVMKAKRVPKEWQTLWAKYIDIRPLVDDIKRYLNRAEQLYARFAIKPDSFQKILKDVADKLGYTKKEMEFLEKTSEFERFRTAWNELIGSVERLVSLSEYSPKASKYALGKLKEMIDSLPLSNDEKEELKAIWEEYIRNRPVKSEARTYITQLINIYVEGLIDKATFEKELKEMTKWGFSDDELNFYKAQAELRKARKLKIPLLME